MSSFVDGVDDPQFQLPRIYAEAAWLYGAIVTAILYGVVVVLYTMCAHSLWGRICSRGGSAKKNWFLFIYVNIVFALSTLYVASNAQTTQLGFINNRDYPGGPSAYEVKTPSIALNLSFTVSNWCADGLMIWRCIVVYKDSRFHLAVSVIGYSMFLASVVTGLLWFIVVSRASTSTTSWMALNFVFPYLGISLAINILICLLTVARLLYHRASISKVFGPEYGILYTSLATIIIESAAVYSISSLLYLIPSAAGSLLANAFVQILGEAQVIAPLLIIHRVSEGKAWSEDMTSRLSSSTPQVHVVRRMTAAHTSPFESLRAKRASIHVALESVQRAEGGEPPQTADKETQGLAV